MKILVTGGAGFIGSHIVEQLHERAEVRVLDNLVSGFRRNLTGFRCEFIAGSILDRATLHRAMSGVDFVFHLAAMVSVPESVQKPKECVAINTEGTRLVLEAAAEAGVKKLAFSSSAAVYGDNSTVPKVETMTPEPISPYGTTKREGEILCEQFAREKRLATVSLRYFNVFGPRQNPRSQYAAAVPAFIERALRDEPLLIHGDGEQTRDFVPVQTVAAANIFLATQSDATGVFNVAGGHAITINQLARQIVNLAASKSELQHGPTRAGDVKHSCADTERLQATGFSGQKDFSSALRETVEFFRRAGK
jgi:UDP-glucose 4-epimerase